MHFRRYAAAILPLSITIGMAMPLRCIGQSTTPISTVGIVVPSCAAVSGQQDQGAISELLAHRKAVGSLPWLGMQGTGTITYAQEPTSYQATLSNTGDDHFRLDVQTQSGQESIRINQLIGKIRSSDGKVATIPPVTAGSELFPFEFVRTAKAVSKSSSFCDHGIVSASGQDLHRITYVRPSIGRVPSTNSQDMATDLYFDPVSHLLVKTVSQILMSEGRPVRFLSTVTYSDYRQIGTLMVPFLYTETLDGQQYRKLQLSTVQLNPSLDSTYFEF